METESLFHKTNVFLLIFKYLETETTQKEILITLLLATYAERKENSKKLRFIMGESMGGAVVLLLHRKKPAFWDGAILLAPMCKVSLSFSQYAHTCMIRNFEEKRKRCL